MPTIDEILKLPKEKQLEIMAAIQDKLEDDAVEDSLLSEQQVSFIQKRIKEIESGNNQTFTWLEVKEKLANRWNTL